MRNAQYKEGMQACIQSKSIKDLPSLVNMPMALGILPDKAFEPRFKLSGMERSNQIQ